MFRGRSKPIRAFERTNGHARRSGSPLTKKRLRWRRPSAGPCHDPERTRRYLDGGVRRLSRPIPPRPRRCCAGAHDSGASPRAGFSFSRCLTAADPTPRTWDSSTGSTSCPGLTRTAAGCETSDSRAKLPSEIMPLVMRDGHGRCATGRVSGLVKALVSEGVDAAVARG